MRELNLARFMYLTKIQWFLIRIPKRVSILIFKVWKEEFLQNDFLLRFELWILLRWWPLWFWSFPLWGVLEVSLSKKKKISGPDKTYFFLFRITCSSWFKFSNKNSWSIFIERVISDGKIKYKRLKEVIMDSQIGDDWGILHVPREKTWPSFAFFRPFKIRDDQSTTIFQGGKDSRFSLNLLFFFWIWDISNFSP